MSDLQRFRSLGSEQRALVAIAVLLDGKEAENYLANDALLGKALQRAAHELASIEPELRMPLAGSLLRTAIDELDANSNMS